MSLSFSFCFAAWWDSSSALICSETYVTCRLGRTYFYACVTRSDRSVDWFWFDGTTTLMIHSHVVFMLLVLIACFSVIKQPPGGSKKFIIDMKRLFRSQLVSRRSASMSQITVFKASPFCKWTFQIADPSRWLRNWSDELRSTLAFSLKPKAQRSSDLRIGLSSIRGWKENFPLHTAQHKLNLHYGLKTNQQRHQGRRKIINYHGQASWMTMYARRLLRKHKFQV